jgi:hypothetical protein
MLQGHSFPVGSLVGLYLVGGSGCQMNRHSHPVGGPVGLNLAVRSVFPLFRHIFFAGNRTASPRSADLAFGSVALPLSLALCR